MRIPISVRIWGGSVDVDELSSEEEGGDAEASNLASPSRCKPSFWAPEIAVTKIASRADDPSWPSSKSIIAACKTAIEPQKSVTPPWKQRKASDLQVLECTSDARSSSTRSDRGVGDQPSRRGEGWKARASTSCRKGNVSICLMRGIVAYARLRGDRQVYPWELY